MSAAPRRHAPIRGEGRVVSLSDEGGVNRRDPRAHQRLARLGNPFVYRGHDLKRFSGSSEPVQCDGSDWKCVTA